MFLILKSSCCVESAGIHDAIEVVWGKDLQLVVTAMDGYNYERCNPLLVASASVDVMLISGFDVFWRRTEFPWVPVGPACRI